MLSGLAWRLLVWLCELTIDLQLAQLVFSSLFTCAPRRPIQGVVTESSRTDKFGEYLTSRETPIMVEEGMVYGLSPDER